MVGFQCQIEEFVFCLSVKAKPIQILEQEVTWSNLCLRKIIMMDQRVKKLEAEVETTNQKAITTEIMRI